MASIEVTRTYLEMGSPGELRATATPVPAPRVERIGECLVSFFRYLYAEVGRAFHWVDRLGWTDAMVESHLASPAISLWLLTWQAAPAGYFELRQHADGSAEIAYFGLLPDYIGRGWGKFLLTEAVRAAWSLNPTRVWIHTCTLDHPAALPNYVRRGFKPVREEIYSADVRSAPTG
ncbi:MAG TPA: GNAT family N-acetyltransferase [Gemmatimonadales bacterium]|jgi:ribosomal protein S18 acetylase RimI-like enzyme|nr:GNAT family N-acetyltransferase [Gemmatimonadales bacterium]